MSTLDCGHEDHTLALFGRHIYVRILFGMQHAHYFKHRARRTKASASASQFAVRAQRRAIHRRTSSRIFNATFRRNLC